jgi:proline iminopeptidase
MKRVSASLFWTLALFPALALFPSVYGQTPVTHAAGAYAQVNGAKLWYETEGQGEPLVLVAGGPGNSHSEFHPFFSRLADRFQVVYFDAFGVGQSGRAKSRSEYTFAREVEDLEGLRKALGLSRINLLGHSFGGMVAQAYALKYAQSVKRLVLADTFHSGRMWQANNDSVNYEIRNQYPELWEDLQRVRKMGFRSSSAEQLDIYRKIPPGLFYFHDASKAKLLPDGEGNNQIYYTIAGEDADFVIGGDIAGLDFRADLPKLKMPILVLAGRFDRVSLPRYAVEYKRFAPQARFMMMEESGHFPFVEEPEATLAVLREFLGQ